MKNIGLLLLLLSFYTLNFGQGQASGDDISEDDLIVEYAENGNLKELKIFLDKNPNVDIDKEYPGGWTLLMWASSGGHLDIVKYLREVKLASVNYSTSSYNHTALMVASEKGYIKTVEYLVVQGADLGERNKRGDTALMIAVENGHTEIVEYLKMREQLSKDFVPENYRIKDLALLSQDHIILVLQKKEMKMEDYWVGYPIILLKKNKDKYIEVGRTQTVSVGNNSAGEGFTGIVVKGDYFTLEQIFGGRTFILSYTTFKYNTSTGEFLLNKYSEVYIDRFAESQDPSEPKHFKVEKDKYSFEDFTEDFFIALRNNEL